MTFDLEEAETMLEDCEARESRLTDWEAKFVDSLRHQLEHDKRLSQRQMEILEGVWSGATARG